MTDLFPIFSTCFPTAVRDPDHIRQVLADPANQIFTHFENDSLAGALVLHKDTVYMLGVLPPYRNRGIGSALLTQAENAVRQAGYDNIRVGAGETYLLPGVPSSEMLYPETLAPHRLDPGLDTTAVQFFQHRGYFHSWTDSNCFDMRFPLCELPDGIPEIGATVDGVQYRFAVPAEMEAVLTCTDAAYPGFTPFYKDHAQYTPASPERVLIAWEHGRVVGTLLVGMETEGSGRGSVGCTTVLPEARGRHIGVNMVRIGTRYLRDAGMQEGFLGYTYSGLDRMYGYAGYRICVYYMMAQKYL